MNAKFKVGVIGCGFVADGHISCLQRIPDVEVVGVADTDEQAAKRVKNQFGIIRTFPTADALYAEMRKSRDKIPLIR